MAEAVKLAPDLGHEQVIVINLSGRGDKYAFTAARALGQELEL